MVTRPLNSDTRASMAPIRLLSSTKRLVILHYRERIPRVAGLLDGVKVLDMGRLVAPAYASARLRDLGAEVVKIELAPDGDYLRSVPPLFQGIGVLHWELSRGKRSIGLDWRRPEAREVLYELAGQSDVFIESTVGDSARRMGLDWETMQRINPRMIHCSITSFGRDRPYSNLRAHGLNIDAAAAIAPVTVNAAGQSEIGHLTHWVASQAAGLNAALAIGAALFARERSGSGRHIEVACWDAAVSFNYQSLVCQANLGVDFPYPSPDDGLGPRYNSYTTADGRAVLLAAAEPKFWVRFCEVVGRPDLVHDADSFSYGETGASGAEQRSEIAAIIAARTAAEWIRLAVDRELPLTPIHDPAELLDLDQTLASGMLSHETELGNGTSFRHVASPALVDGAPFTPGGGAPAFAADSAEVLRSYGFGEAGIEGLILAGAVVTATA
jgi:crotonobetainyl-CoA:carnitine CoA-transferase CaiB-like acyl-CoA transferase